MLSWFVIIIETEIVTTWPTKNKSCMRKITVWRKFLVISTFSHAVFPETDLFETGARRLPRHETFNESSPNPHHQILPANSRYSSAFIWLPETTGKPLFYVVSQGKTQHARQALGNINFLEDSTLWLHYRLMHAAFGSGRTKYNPCNAVEVVWVKNCMNFLQNNWYKFG